MARSVIIVICVLTLYGIFFIWVLLTVQGSGAREGDVESLVDFGTIVILPCESRASNRIERALELLTMILLLRTRRDLRKGKGK